MDELKELLGNYTQGAVGQLNMFLQSLKYTLTKASMEYEKLKKENEELKKELEELKKGA